MFGKNKQTANVENAVSRAVDYELTIADIAKRSEKRAWFVAFSAIVMSLILAGGYFYMLPLKQKVPYMIMADAYTGRATVAELRGDFETNSILTSEAFNISNAVHFVIARESYDYNRIGERDWDTVFVMAMTPVAKAYEEYHNATLNPNSPSNLYGKNASIRIKILSTSLAGDGPSTIPKGAVVRYQRVLYNHADGTTKYMDSKVATMEFKYDPELKLNEQKRVLNPLGFQVVAYRTDTDFASPPPPELEVVEMPSSQPTSAMPQGVAVPQAIDATGNPLPPQQVPTPGAPQTIPAPQPNNSPQTPNPNNANGAVNR
jgi:type IV secretion system protein VirB8